MRPKLVEGSRLISDIYIHDILLKEPAYIKERREARTDIEIVLVEDPLVEPRLLISLIAIS